LAKLLQGKRKVWLHGQMSEKDKSSERLSYFLHLARQRKFNFDNV